MVDIVICTNAILQMDVVVDRSNDIFLCNMLRNQVMDRPLDRIFDIIDIIIFLQYFFKDRIVY